MPTKEIPHSHQSIDHRQEDPNFEPKKDNVNNYLGYLSRVLGDIGDVNHPNVDHAKPTVPSYQNEVPTEQAASEEVYDISVDKAVYDERLSAEEIVERMERNHMVKTAPRLSEQVNDSTRTNRIIAIPDHNPLGAGATSDEYYERRVTYSEAEVLAATNEYLETAIACEASLGSETVAKARSLHKNLTFIGEKEYQEATAGIALYWKALLERDPDQQILALGGEIGNLGPYGKQITKSDDYLLDNILAHFSDDEVARYKGRLITDVSEVTKDASEVRVVLIDDWTIGGAQLIGVANRFKEKHPELASSVEIQLITANSERIAHGLSDDTSEGMRSSVPVRAYFKAHEAADVPGISRTKAHITGSHSSVDTDFEYILAKITSQARKADYLSNEQHAILDVLPPMANIVRPYRLRGIELTQRDRFKLPNYESKHDVDDQQDSEVW